MRIPFLARVTFVSILGCGSIACPAAGTAAVIDSDAQSEPQWQVYGGDPGGSRASALAQINRNNVGELETAWTYRTGELGAGFARADKLTFEATPVLLDRTLYVSTATSIVIALDAVTGTQRWRYDPHISRTTSYAEAASRGVALWVDAAAPRNSICARRVLLGTLDARLIALDADTGKACPGFGLRGAVNLTHGVHLTEPGEYLVTSPPALYRDVVIVGSAIGDNRAVNVESGVIRAFDARTGIERWSWYPLGDEPTTTPRIGGANAWSIFSVDPARGLVFIPTGSAAPDYFGGKRPGNNEHANSLVALNAETGELVWHQQLIHHDLWDYDVAAQPLLIDVEREGKLIPVVVAATKTGMLFVFDRETGAPIFEVDERAVPRSDVPGEVASVTQPFPSTPSLVSQAAITPDDAWGLTFYDRGKCRDRIASLRSEGIFTPPSLKGSIVSPSSLGGVNWGSLAFDSDRQLVFAAVNHLPMVVTLIPRDQLAKQRTSGAFVDAEFAEQRGTPYAMRRELLASPWGLPCTAPPWGTLAAIDLRRNTIRWQVMLGSTRDSAPWFVPSRTIGMPNLGGPIVTDGDVVFIAAAADQYLRAFDIETGRELWKGRLPAGGQATPMTYALDGRQFVVIAAGGHGALRTKRGDYLVAFALPKQ
ncbi:MAG TPA: pyrroloquinoline quinone-dependent dehydrogenase [Steroidobacteraceae bacterium]|nr:pyrroloquinoline quinone-dependent dehydrogenase [Steroidobacteraceae bacterium]